MVTKKSKNQLRRERQKELRQNEHTTAQEQPIVTVESIKQDKPSKISSSLSSIDLSDPVLAQFEQVFKRFQPEDQESNKENEKENEESQRGHIIENDNDTETTMTKVNKPITDTISNKQKRKLAKVPLSVLKGSTPHPELVEWYDVDSKDPFFTISIKSSKNAIPIPSHWQLKREFLSSKRDKKPFELPPAIQATGIAEMRDTANPETDKNGEEVSLKAKQRQKVRPKLNTLDLDYQKLYDAFFKNQKKPKLYGIGETYYEGKEFEELDISVYKPGVISPGLREALGVPETSTLPWVLKIKQSGCGLPPSYPDLKLPGFNVPLEGQSEGVVEIGKDEALGIRRELFGKLLSLEEENEDDEEEEKGDDGKINEESDEDVDVGTVENEEGAVVVPEEELKVMTTGQVIETIKPAEDNTVVQELAEPLSDEEDIPLPEQFPIKTSTEKPIEPKKLYQILKEKFQDRNGSDEGGLLSGGGSRSYEMGDKRPGDTDGQEKDAKKQKVQDDGDEEDDDEEEEEGAKFKF